jgi:parvulin-like peptidyl-prolyl isomerase
MVAILQIGDAQLNPADLIAKLDHYQLLPKLVQEVVIDQALETLDISPQDAYQTFCQQRQLLTPEQQQAWMQQQQLSAEQMQRLALREIKLARFKEETWGTQVESYFLQQKARLDRVLYSLIRTKDASLAQELYFRLNDDGEFFSELAKAYSEGQEAQTGGLIGPVELTVPHPMLARLLSIGQPGQIWSPTPIGEWYVIARLEKFLPAQMDEPMRQRLLDDMFKAWLQQQLQKAEVKLVDAPAELPANADALKSDPNIPTDILRHSTSQQDDELIPDAWSDGESSIAIATTTQSASQSASTQG